MRFIYNIGIHFANFILTLVGFFNKKIQKGVIGRKKTFKSLRPQITETTKTIWFHCASLGEYEQGFPVFKELRNYYKNHTIVLSFFSPSGYEIRKNTPIADIVVYLPIDTSKNAKKFIQLLKPELTVFVKYDIWPNFLNQLKLHKYRAILISAAFRKNQPYFKFYGKIFREALFAFEHIFTQNIESKQLLKTIGYSDVTVSGDTRYDRVSYQLEQNNTLSFVESFKDKKLCIVAGSTWPEDEMLWINYINSKSADDLKFIIAPHNIKSTQISNLKNKISLKTILYSEMDNRKLENYQVFIIDTIGLLTKIYSYADIAYVGGAMGNTGLHNILEPAVFGAPVVIGDNFDKFPEAKAMINNGGVLAVSNQEEFNHLLNSLVCNKEKRHSLGKKNRSFIEKNTGAVVQILDYLRI